MRAVYKRQVRGGVGVRTRHGCGVVRHISSHKLFVLAGSVADVIGSAPRSQDRDRAPPSTPTRETKKKWLRRRAVRAVPIVTLRSASEGCVPEGRVHTWTGASPRHARTGQDEEKVRPPRQVFSAKVFDGGLVKG